MVGSSIPLRHAQVIALELVRRGMDYPTACKFLDLPVVFPGDTFSDIDIPVAQFAGICDQVNELYGDKLFCFRLGTKLSLNEFSVLGGFLNHQETLADALHEFVKYYYLVGKYCQPELHDLNETIGIFCKYDEFTINEGAAMAELRMAGITSLVRHITSHLYDDVIAEIHFQHAPRALPEIYQSIANCNVVFESDFSGFTVPKQYMQMTLLSSDDDIRNSYYERLKSLNDIDNNSFAYRVSQILEASMPICFSQPQTAKELAMSVSKLKRLLVEEGCSFTEIQDQVRGSYIKKQLSHTPHTLEDIAREMGFNSSSSLSQLFKRIYGITPSEYRRSVA